MSLYLLRNRHLLALVLLTIVAGGLSALRTLPRQEDPRLSNWFGIVEVPFPGAPADRVESLVARPIEERLRELGEIATVESASLRDVAILSLEIDNSILDTDRVWSRVRDRLADAAALLPPGAGRPELDHERTETAFARVVAIAWRPRTTPDLVILERWAEELADRLRGVPGTELVRVHGAPGEEIRVTADPSELAAIGLSAADLARQVEQADAKGTAGVLRGPLREATIEVTGELTSEERVRRIPLRRGGSDAGIRLGAVATVERASRSPVEELGLSDGERAVYVAARARPERRLDAWSKDVSKVIDALREETAGSLRVRTVFDQSEYTTARLSGLVGSLLLGAAIVAAILLALMGWRSALLVVSALPLTGLSVLFLLEVLGVPLHQMSVTGMIIALGLLIDNAIVMVDELATELRRRPADRARAVRAALRQLFVPLLGSTLTTVLAFLPILLLEGAVGQFVGAIAISVILAIVCSFLISTMVLPALTAGLLRLRSRRTSSWWREGVRGGRAGTALAGTVRWAVRHPRLGMLAALALPVAGFVRAPHHRQQFFPSTDRDQIEIEVRMSSGTPIERTIEVVSSIDEAVRGDPDVRAAHWLVGGSFPSVYYNLIMSEATNPAYAQGMVRTASPAAARALVRRWERGLGETFPGAQVIVRELGQGPPVEAPIEVRVLGPGLERLREIGDEVRSRLAAIPRVVHTRQTLTAGQPQLRIEADEDETARTGLTLVDVADQLRASLDGVVGGSVLEETESVPVRIRFPDRSRRDPGRLHSTNLVVPGERGWVPLASVGSVALRPVVASIPRRDGERQTSVLGYIDADALPLEVTAALKESLERDPIALPIGYRIELGGEEEEQGEAVASLVAYLPVLVLLMAGTIVLSFRSVAAASLIAAVALLTFGLGSLAIWVAGHAYGFMAMIGTAGLVGVAVNDSIVVLAAIRSDPRARAGDPDAIVRRVLGCGRHVVATTLTTIGGFLPLIVAGGGFWPPLAVVMAGGVAGATLLALVFIPAAHRAIAGRREAMAAARERS